MIGSALSSARSVSVTAVAPIAVRAPATITGPIGRDPAAFHERRIPRIYLGTWPAKTETVDAWRRAAQHGGVHKLVGLPYSPWTVRARWALVHHGIAHSFEPYLPMLGELPLRARLGRLRGSVSVPILFAHEGSPIEDSFEIAAWANAHSETKSALFPEKSLADLRRWNERGNTLLEATRMSVIANTLGDPEALVENAPRFIPGFLAGATSRLGAQFLRLKYSNGATLARSKHDMGCVLADLRVALRGKDLYLLGDFSDADMVMATSLQGIFPAADRFIRLRPAVRRTWTHADLASQYEDLIAWRDKILDKHFPGWPAA